MKWLLLLCLSGANCLAQFNFIDQAFLNGGNASAILFQSASGGADNTPFFQALSQSNAASWFNPTASGTAHYVDVSLNNGGSSPTFNLQAQIWTYDAGADTPGVAIGTASDWVNGAVLTAAYEYVRFPNMSAVLTSGTDYCLVIYCDAEDFVNLVYFNNSFCSDPGHNTMWAYSQPFTFWAPISGSPTEQFTFTVYQ